MIKSGLFVITCNVAIIEEFASGCPVKLAFCGKMISSSILSQSVHLLSDISVLLCLPVSINRQ